MKQKNIGSIQMTNLKNSWSICLLLLLVCIGFQACNQQQEGIWVIPVQELNKQEYPDNPDLESMHSLHDEVLYESFKLTEKDSNRFDIVMIPNADGDTIEISSISLMEWVPTIASHLKGDEYLSTIAVVNQEWNRNQIRFDTGDFTIKGANRHNIERVDVARNCLNAYLWEVIMWAEENGTTKPYYHGWFNFPKDLYARLFEARNGVSFEKYAAVLEEWTDPASEKINLSKLRTVVSEQAVAFSNHNQESYPLKGERSRKLKNVLYPKNTTKIQDFLTDKTLYATFSQPGFYNPKDPRKTELSRLSQLEEVLVRKIKPVPATNDSLLEIELVFNNPAKDITTRYYISGIDLAEIPVLDVEQANDGWQNSMGFGNHTFYETYEHAQKHSSLTSPYFAALTDGQGRWLDSHKIGIDGPLMHLDKEGKLHLWILSFERHSFVGHYSFRAD
ncbi:hypothetical protein D770_09940 [Flammeovirgaceae bacterium 311]|nr:hypothetical protein D770_09940 [Flammeovirgaceae bacterium 311]